MRDQATLPATAPADAFYFLLDSLAFIRIYWHLLAFIGFIGFIGVKSRTAPGGGALRDIG